MGATTFTVGIVCKDTHYGGALASAAAGAGLTVIGVEAEGSALGAEELSVDLLILVDPEPSGVMDLAARGQSVLVVGPDDGPTMVEIVEAGALGYVEEGAQLEEVIEAARSVVSGVAVVPPMLLGSLLRSVVERRRAERDARQQLDVLTPRERQVFELAARGYDKHALADSLFISPETARTHVQNVFRKLNLHSQAELVALAAECGLDLIDGMTE